jgi:hypothetical protein
MIDPNILNDRRFLLDSKGGFDAGIYQMNCEKFQKLLAHAKDDVIYASIIIGIVSIMERLVRTISENVRIMKHQNLSLSDFEGSWIRKSKAFFNELCGFTSPSNKEWKLIEEIYLVRNILAHNYGNVSDLEDEGTRKKINKIIKNRNDLNVDHGWLIISSDYCHHVIEVAKEFGAIINREIERLADTYLEFEKNKP